MWLWFQISLKPKCHVGSEVVSWGIGLDTSAQNEQWKCAKIWGRFWIVAIRGINWLLGPRAINFHMLIFICKLKWKIFNLILVHTFPNLPQMFALFPILKLSNSHLQLINTISCVFILPSNNNIYIYIYHCSLLTLKNIICLSKWCINCFNARENTFVTLL